MAKVNSFFDKSFQTPCWLQRKVSRRNALKAAAGATMVAAMPVPVWSASLQSKYQKALATNPWQTLDSVLDHMLPPSPTGPSAKEIQATQYLYNVVFSQPTEQAEIEFIYKGVGWLNSFTQSQLKRDFSSLSFDEKETMLRAISKSQAGENWLSNLVSYIFEAMLTPPSYGGNPDGIGWKWLEHQPGFPLPPVGKRYYELPGQQAVTIAKKVSQTDVIARQSVNKVGTRKS